LNFTGNQAAVEMKDKRLKRSARFGSLIKL